MSKRFEYHININERGIFDCDVRDENDRTVFHERSEDEPIGLITDGFMKHIHDMDGLCKYLNDLGIMKEKDYLVDCS